MVLSARGTEQQSHGTDNVQAFINLLLALGKAGKVSCGYGCLTGQGNGQGGREHGQKADQLPGYRRIADPAHRAAVAAVWEVDPDSLPAPGLHACALFDALGSDVRGLLVMASNIVVSAPDASRLSANLDRLDLLVVADMFLSETAARADVVLPITQWAEEEGTMTNLEGRVLHRRRAKAPPPGVRSDTAVLHDLAAALGSTARFDADPAAVFDGVPPRERGRRRRLRRHHRRAHRLPGRRVLALPDRGASRHAAPVPGAVRDPMTGVRRVPPRPVSQGSAETPRRASIPSC